MGCDDCNEKGTYTVSIETINGKPVPPSENVEVTTYCHCPVGRALWKQETEYWYTRRPRLYAEGKA